MMQFITSPEKFADWFNIKVPGACRDITADDVKLLTECRLIKKHGYYFHDDLQTVIGILNYEQLRQKKTEKQKASLEPPRCKICGQPLPAEAEDKKGRPKEYCEQCQPSRAKERYRKWRRKESTIFT